MFPFIEPVTYSLNATQQLVIGSNYPPANPPEIHFTFLPFIWQKVTLFNPQDINSVEDLEQKA